MPKITFITPDGKSTQIEANTGTLMEAAVQNNIDGIDAECGGVCSCATCHIHIAEKCTDQLPQTEDLEASLLELEDHANERAASAAKYPSPTTSTASSYT